ncbi:MAG: hypothetical protein FJ077_02420 [Cyanobacteria bacterium K_DeepCast_35m_m2_023]|nr:hypothetical protein [Cyanobacteria bacterium K_DeepCast_35m_m2_023]
MNAPVLAALGLTLTAALVGCSEADLPQRTMRRDDCLRDVSLQALPQALRRCDQVVARFANDPGPRNERSVLLALAGDDKAACRDIEAAMTLVRQAPAKRLDPLLVSELKTRHQSCRDAN